MPLSDIQDRISAAALKAGRDIADINLIAISKVQPHVRVHNVLTQGHRVFGENKVQEAAGKWPDFRAEFFSIGELPSFFKLLRFSRVSSSFMIRFFFLVIPLKDL